MNYLVTGGAGFIGSNLVHVLAREGHRVTVLDDLSTGKLENLAESSEGLAAGGGQLSAGLDGRVALAVGSVSDADFVMRHAAGMDGIFHLAAVASVQRSMEEPAACHAVNVTGTLNVLEAARVLGVKRVVLSSSAAVFGDNPELPLRSDSRTGPISPYGLHKLMCEQYGKLYTACGWTEATALRYFNVFGPRQDPNGEYAAVVPRFITALLAGRRPKVFGDGLQTRDFLYVEDVVRANLAAMLCPDAAGRVLNLCAGRETSLLDLLDALAGVTGKRPEPEFLAPREGDIRRSFGSGDEAVRLLGLPPWTSIAKGLAESVEFFLRKDLDEQA
ncbi:MAG: NAD-dependent epimerase/dehydratase family protein [Deltaproteobacteria bacterium]|nr:NAD-dependent epimerase/dehydratase family protein [Deltaproteobacteria bacterium]